MYTLLFSLECKVVFSAKLGYSDDEREGPNMKWKLMNSVANEHRPVSCKFTQLVLITNFYNYWSYKTFYEAEFTSAGVLLSLHFYKRTCLCTHNVLEMFLVSNDIFVFGGIITSAVLDDILLFVKMIV